MARIGLFTWQIGMDNDAAVFVFLSLVFFSVYVEVQTCINLVFQIQKEISALVKNRIEEKREEIGLRSMTKAPTTTEKIQLTRWKHENATTTFDYTTISDRLRTVSWSNDSHPTGVVKPVYWIPTFLLTANAV